MGGLFSSPKAPAPDPSIAAAQKAQQMRLDKQAVDLASKEKQEMASLQARRRARRTGGLNLLLSEDREDAELGLKTTLSA
tara:strand:- start:1489 stop:1728 length:240 start_codon:yes stop_codon:yes gene_type:complete